MTHAYATPEKVQQARPASSTARARAAPLSQTEPAPGRAPARLLHEFAHMKVLGPHPGPTPASPSGPPPCAIKTVTAAHAPDGSLDSRRVVGVREEVAMSAAQPPIPATWTATDGTLGPPISDVVVWTAPEVEKTCVVTATPRDPAIGPCSVSIDVVRPTERVLKKTTDVVYQAGLAGSGFIADVTILPREVAFERIEVREEEAVGVATGYYDTVLHWNGKKHLETKWTVPHGNNLKVIDTVGTPAPGTPGPFSQGTFQWDIPQTYRAIGSTAAQPPYAIAIHLQEMFAPSGAEGTSKEGEGRGRRP